MNVIGKIFKNGNSQAVRIPKELRIDAEEVYIEKTKDGLLLKPKEKMTWEEFFKKYQGIPDFEIDRSFAQKTQERELF